MKTRATKRPNGELVTIYLDNGAAIEARVVDMLSTQFTARFLDGTDALAFRFYADRGRTWEDV